jgi:uncharacterized spore protein YtfJ
MFRMGTKEKEPLMAKFDEIIAEARDSLTARRVYGEPYETDGVTLIPAAAIRGGGGVGEGDDGSSGSGSGGGFGMTARPVGAYQIKDGEVSWVAAADTTRVIILSQLVAIVALLVLRSILRSRKSAD